MTENKITRGFFIVSDKADIRRLSMAIFGDPNWIHDHWSDGKPNEVGVHIPILKSHSHTRARP